MKSSGAIETGISDHLRVYTVLKAKMLHANAEVVKKRIFKTFNRDDFQKYLSRVPFHAAYVFDDIDDVYWCWETLYNPVQCDLSNDDLQYNRSLSLLKFGEKWWNENSLRKNLIDHVISVIGRATV